MKKIFLPFAASFILSMGIYAQAPQKMSYQAVIRNASNALLTNTPVGMQISILQGSSTGSAVYVEVQTQSTNANGLVSLEVGTGTPITGTFSSINWASGPYFIKTETDPLGGTAYTIAGTNELISVPYALFSANSVPGPVGPAGPQGIQGIPGANGIDGVDGTNGIDGTNGVAGPQGIQGLTGATGPAGPIGPAGPSGSLNAWGLTGSAGTVDGTNFIGTTDNKPFNIRVNNQKAGKIDVAAEGNTFYGYLSGNSNSAGNNENTGIGKKALFSNTIGYLNTATGANALMSNTTGNFNTADGAYALYSNTTGHRNTATGEEALLGNTTGFYNTANGMGALITNTTGNDNVAIGHFANVSTGALSNAIVIGSSATVNSSNKVRIGNPSVTVIEGQVAYSFPSDGRFKYNINQSDVKGLDFILKLKPVEYNFDTKKFEEFLTQNMPDSIRRKHFENTDFSKSSSIRQSGFIAQDVENAMKESNYNFNGVHKPTDENDNYSVAYSLFVVPLVKGMQEQQKMIEELKVTNELLKTTNSELKAEIEKIKMYLEIKEKK